MGLLAAFRRRPFLTETERGQLADGLAHACRHAGGPIGLRIDERASGDPEARARLLFEEWAIPTDERPRAILIYACGATHRFAVVGGEEVRRVAPAAFWEQVHVELQRHFDDERYCDGLFKAIAQVAIQFQHHSASPAPEEPSGSV